MRRLFYRPPDYVKFNSKSEKSYVLMNIPNAFRDRERFCNPNRTKYKDSWIGNSSNSRQKHCLITLFFMLVNRPLVENLKKAVYLYHQKNSNRCTIWQFKILKKVNKHQYKAQNISIIPWLKGEKERLSSYVSRGGFIIMT